MKKNNYLHIFTLLIATNLFAEDNVHCPQVEIELSKEVDRLDNFSLLMAKNNSDIDWWAATPDQINNRKCKEKLPSLDEIEKEIDSLTSSKTKLTKNINGVEFTDESPDLIDAFENFTVKRNLYGAPQPSVDVQKKYSINPACKKVKCAVEKIYGKELGNKLLYLKLKYGFNSSELSHESSSRLSINEVNSLISAVAAFPASRFPIDKNKQLTKFKRGQQLASHNESTLAYAAIAFYDSWSKESEPMRQYVAFHEIGHYVGMEFKLDENPAWLGFSGWVEKDGKWKATKKNAVASKYGATNPAEDFAESVSAYRYNPKLLKAINAEKYNFLKETIFDGLEYIEAEQCEKSKSNIAKLSKNSPSSNQRPTETEIKAAIKSCSNETRSFLLESAPNEERLMACFNKAKNVSNMIANIDKIVPALKYPKLVAEGLLHQKPTAAAQTGVPPADFKETRAYLRQEFIKGIVDWDKEHYFNYSLKNNVNDICNETWGEHSYQSVLSKNPELSKAIDAYTSRDEFNKFFVKLCNNINKGKKNLKPVTKEEVEKALGAYP